MLQQKRCKTDKSRTVGDPAYVDIWICVIAYLGKAEFLLELFEEAFGEATLYEDGVRSTSLDDC